ncbi:MAG: hypothetical protein KDN20_00885 [Verrucomicrobiae bacterium]|nr:hypothetical protein [Verrucomicrobiae bacterium]
MKTKIWLIALAIGMASSSSLMAVDYVTDVLPIMKEHCWDCHSNEESVKGNLALDDVEEVRDYQVGTYNIIRPGNPEESSFLEKMKLPSGHTDFMPRKGQPLPAEQLAIIEKWIAAGAVIDAKKPSDKEKAFLATGESVAMEDEKLKFHSWTNTAGTVIEARFVRLTGDAVTVVMKDGKSYNVPLAKLSAESQTLAKKLAGE